MHNSEGQQIAANNDWREAQPAAIQATTIAPTHDREAAILATLPPGSYTAVVVGNGAASGTALVEVYDLSRATGRLANISTRGEVGAAENVMIGGFIISGPQSKRVIVRGLGPSLASSLPGALADPSLELRNADGALLASNTRWQSAWDGGFGMSYRGIAPQDPAESAISYHLVPGNFTVILKSASGSTGIGLIEIYDSGR